MRRGTRLMRWTPARIAALGTAPDHVLAARWGTHQGEVMVERQRRGIPAHNGTPAPTWLTLAPDQQRLWGIYADAASRGGNYCWLVLGWLAAQGWQPEATEIIGRTTVARASAYRHAAALRTLPRLNA